LAIAALALNRNADQGKKRSEVVLPRF